MSGLHDLAALAMRALDPEDAHGLTIKALTSGLGPRAPRSDDAVLATSVGGLVLPSAVGLAAGFDKNAEVPDAMLRAGFGFVECGTVTPLEQAGNPKPRLFRLTPDRAVINRLGFNNEGLDAFARRLSSRGRRGVVGANIGANKDSTDRAGDYVTGLQRLWGHCDYFTLNISSPNTPGLRALQAKEALDELLGRIAEAREVLKGEADYPLFLKVAPDVADVEIEPIIASVVEHGINALIVGNTTVSRPSDLRSPWKEEAGGLSGRPLMSLSTQVLSRFYQAAAGRVPLIGVGGIASGADAFAKVRAGAEAVQLYSALVFEGAGLIPRLKADLAARLKAEGFKSISDAVGTAHR